MCSCLEVGKFAFDSLINEILGNFMCLFGICSDILYMVDPIVSGDGQGFWGVDVSFCRVSKHEFEWGV